MSVDSPGEFIKSLLNEYEKIADKYPEILVETCPDNDLINGILRSLEGVKGIPTAMDWYSKIPKHKNPKDKGYYLGLLLNKLDKIYSEKPVTRYPISQGHILLGRRWWNVFAKLMPTKRERLSRPAFSVSLPFPHIRSIRVDDEEWLKNIEIDRAFESVISDGVLRLGFCSLTGSSVTHFMGTIVLNSQDGIYGFCAECIKYAPSELDCSFNTDKNLSASQYQDGYIKELLECIQWARGNHIHVLCFPELSVCPEGRKAIRKEISLDRGHLCMIVPGSYHNRLNETSNLSVNAAPIWLVKADNSIIELASFEKTEPFSIDISVAQEFPGMLNVVSGAIDNSCGSLKEHIRPGKMIRVLLTPLGIFGIAICKDRLVPSEIMKRYDMLVDHLLVISMNFSPIAWFWPVSEQTKHAYSSATFYVNASQVVNPDNSDVDMVFWHIPCHLPKWSKNTSKERYYRKLPSSIPRSESKIKYCQLPENGRVCCEIEIPTEMLQ